MSARLKAIGAVVGLVVLGVLLLRGGTEAQTAGPRPLTSTTTSASTSTSDPETGLPLVALSSLPQEAQRTVRLIERSGPFPYAKDGATFGNRERMLPAQRPGWYREYTVRTPGEDDRGARRIVTGDDGRQLFWTDDHYQSFSRVQV